MFAARDSAELGDDGIGEVDAAATLGQRGTDNRVLVDPELAGVQEALDQFGTASGADPTLISSPITWKMP